MIKEHCGLPLKKIWEDESYLEWQCQNPACPVKKFAQNKRSRAKEFVEVPKWKVERWKRISKEIPILRAEIKALKRLLEDGRKSGITPEEFKDRLDRIKKIKDQFRMIK